MKNPPEASRAPFVHAALLAAAFTLVLAAGRNRNVDLALKVDPLPLPSASAGPPHQAIEVLDDGVIELYRGFFPIETGTDGASYRWMSGRGVVGLRHGEPSMMLTLRGWVPRAPDQPAPTVKLVVDKQQLGSFEAPTGPFTRTFVVDNLEPRSQAHRLFIEVSRTVVTPPDPRALGLCVEAISWRSASSAHDAGLD